MKLFISSYSTKTAVEILLHNNGYKEYSLSETPLGLQLQLPDQAYTPAELKAAKRHFSFYDLFLWSEKGIENVVLWEKPECVGPMIEEFATFFESVSFDLLTTIEARGFIMGGMFVGPMQKPLITIRKHKKIFEALPGYKQTYTNWKGEKENLYLFESNFGPAKAIFMDDILETGASLQGAVDLLAQEQISVIGAFYLVDASKSEVREQFDFPIHSLLRFDGLKENQPV